MLILVLYIIGSDQKDIKLHLQRVKKLPKLNQSIYSQDHTMLIKRTSGDMEVSICPKP